MPRSTRLIITLAMILIPAVAGFAQEAGLAQFGKNQRGHQKSKG